MGKYQSYKSTEVEWINEIPTHWDCLRGKFLFVNRKDLNRSFQESNLLSLTLQGVLNKNMDSNDGLRPMDYNTYQIFEKDDLVFKLIDLENISTSRVGIVHERGIMSPVYIRLESSKKINSKFSYYFFYNLYKQNIFNFLGSGVRSSLTPSNLLELKIPLPSKEEQNQIINFLDVKTHLIDKLISIKESKISLLKEQSKSLINQYVTKGLNSNVLMKYSGVEWIGEIPKDWGFVKVGHYTNVVRGGSPRPSGDPKYFNGDFIHWITVKEVTSKQSKFIVDTDTKLTEEGMKQSRVLEPETLVLSNSGATLGVPGILKIKGCINDGVVSFLNISPLVFRDYLYYFWTTQTSILLEQQSGYGQPNLNIDIVSNIRFPLPPVIEQNQIVELLDIKTKEFEDLIQLEQKKIILLKEYRQSLISEVVTGKIKVTTDE
jgi:type I restriction enzyme S subunit